VASIWITRPLSPPLGATIFFAFTIAEAHGEVHDEIVAARHAFLGRGGILVQEDPFDRPAKRFGIVRHGLKAVALEEQIELRCHHALVSLYGCPPLQPH